MILRRLLPILAACLILAPLSAADVPRVIFDSDMSSDHDDVGDIAVLHGLASLGEVQIIGMVVSSRNYGTAQFMDAVNTWYGKPDIPIGIPPEIGGVGEYPGMAVGTGRWPHSMGATKEAGLASGACLWAKDLYRKLLAASPDGSVVIVTTGYLQNVEALMTSAPDAWSPLSGLDLIRRKVRLLSCAGGDYPRGSEFNFRVGDTMPRPAYTVVNQWPTSAWFVSYNMGQSIYTGGLLDQARTDSPIRYVYVDSNNEDYPYPSWGQQMVYFAARGLDTFWGGQTTGRNNADTEGSNWWTDTPELSGAQEQGYLLEKVRTPVQESLDALIMLEPNTGAPCKPGQPSNLRAAAVSGSRIDLQWRDNAFNESGFRIERGLNGVYTQVGSVGANVTSFSDTGLSSTANVGYRVKAWNATGDSRWAQTWVYSGWTEVNLTSPGSGPLYTSYRPCDLRYIDGLTQYEHIILNNDSTHGQNLTIAVDAGAIDNQGVFYVYFLYQNPSNWYRLVYDNRHNQQSFRFEKKIAGTITTLGTPRVLAQTTPVQCSEHALHGIGGGSRFRKWQIQVAPGALSFQVSEHYLAVDGSRPVSTISLNVNETLSLASGLIGLGSFQQRPMWENFRFTTGATAALAPAIVAHPQNTSVFEGRAATLAVAASGTNPLNYQWKKGTANVGTNSATFAIATAHAADAGSYTCTVSNGAGAVTSNAAIITVNAVVAPAITSQPVATVAGIGDTAQFAVSASGTAPLAYQWKRGTSNVGTGSAVLTIAGVQAGDAGSYTCTVSNSAGSATSNAAVLTVVAALDPLIAPAALFHDGGGTYGGYPNTADKAFDTSISTFYDAATPTGSYTGIDVGAGKSATVTAIRYYARAGQVGRMVGGVFEGSNALTSGYVSLATVAAASDQAWTTVLVTGAAPYRYLRYRGPTGGCCNVADIEFRGSSGTPVLMAPAITAQPASRTVVVGQTASMTVVATGTAPLTYQWRKGAVNVGGNSPTLSIANAQVADAGSYTCTVSNSVGAVTSQPAVLTVNLAAQVPVITTQPVDALVSVGQAATFTVAAVGTGPLSYQWKLGAAGVGGNSATLSIANAQAADAGSYSCVVSNSAGSTTSAAALLTVTGSGLDPLIVGTVISDGNGSWGGAANTADQAFDGNTVTFYDPAVASAYTGIDVGAPATVTAIRFWARAGWSARMIGGVFEASNSPTSGWIVLAMVATASDSSWTTLTVTGAAAYRYLRYRAAAESWCNVAEIEFHGSSGGSSPVAPVITSQPVSMTVGAGQAATFTVAASGTGPLHYQWKLDGGNRGGDSATLVIANAQVSDAGSYTCIVSNVAGSETSEAASLAVAVSGALDPLIVGAAIISDGNGSWGGSSSTAEKAFDGSTVTFYDPSVAAAYTGIDVGAGSTATVTAIRFWARAGWSARMIGGEFEGSNTPTSGYVALATVVTASDTGWTTLTVNGAAAYRYLRYRAAPGSWCNVAEIEFHGLGMASARAVAAMAPASEAGPSAVAVQGQAGGTACGSGTLGLLLAGMLGLLAVRSRR